MKKLMTLLVVAALALGMISAAQAGPITPTTITITGTAGTGASTFGYTLGNAYSFTWVINSAFANNANGIFAANRSVWRDELTTETPVFTSFYGDGLVGTYVRPTGNEDPWEYIDQYTTNLYLYSGNDEGYSLGLTANSLAIRKLEAWNIVAPLFSNVPSASFVSPSAYYAARAGTYNNVTGQIKLRSVTSQNLIFAANSMTIVAGTDGGSPVPEPGTILAALSILGPAGVMFRRRKA